jgi:sodium-type polar flagellar protein MotX
MQEAPMNRKLLIILMLGAASGVWAEEQALKPTTDIFAGMNMPAAQITADETAAPAPKKLSPEQLAEIERHKQAALAASSAASTLYTEQTVTTIPAAAISTLQLYGQDELITWIGQHKHLQRVKDDQCQLTPDIEARAKVLLLPSYQYLWADMLLTGTCVDKDAAAGVGFMWGAAEQGFPAALDRLAYYYEKGRYVQVDKQQAVVLMHEAAALGYLEAQMDWVDMLLRGLGSPLDYEEAYSWLHHTIITDEKQHAKAKHLLKRLAGRMPANIVTRAKAYRLN